MSAPARGEDVARRQEGTASAPVLAVDRLGVSFAGAGRRIAVVEDLTFSVRRGETLAIVGESGCGKSVTALALTRLLPRTARIDGHVAFEGQDLAALPEKRMRAVRGNRLAIIFQDPMAALNPVMTIGAQLAEAIRAHEAVDAKAARARAEELLELVRIPQARHRLDEYPHRLSGGMRQRVVIAMALASNPSLLIADEPTTALDVTIQAQILALLKRLQEELGMALVLITHDLGVVAENADRVLVMYAGRQVEQQEVTGLFDRPLHPYTRRLMQARPHFTPGAAGERGRLQEIPGIVPAPGSGQGGCAFHARCDIATDVCRAARPLLLPFGAQASAACHQLRGDGVHLTGALP
ncbi:ABC transporter ATP-binding protein [Pigmentiphaga soli]|uniref:ABC transporter ATP-binding protein n=1 Tax=Pigmentiphaga soli TaxID=1007095 RepID=A0ABP8GQF3_9BURK